MAKSKAHRVVMIDGVPHRKRRGKFVPIPAEWQGGGKITHGQTIRSRASKSTAKLRRSEKHRQPDNAKAPTISEYLDQ
jgi:hypothetical protein